MSGKLRSSKGKILIVEDEPDFMRLLRYTFERQGYRVFSAGDAESGLRVAGRSRPDLIVLDVMLPGMDGLKFCAVLRENDRTPVLFLTAKKNEADRDVCARLGETEYLTKPVSILAVLEKAKTLLARGRKALAA